MTHRSTDDDGIFQSYERESKTERWVKYTITTLLILLIPMASVLVRQSVRLAVLESTVSSYAQERMRLDERTQRTLEALSDQHQQFLEFLRDHEVTVTVMPKPAPDPTFPKGYRFDK